jgi:hypothetical protein
VACVFGFAAGADDSAATQKSESGRLGRKRGALLPAALVLSSGELFAASDWDGTSGGRRLSVLVHRNVMVNLPPQGESPGSRSISRVWS